MTLLRFHRTVYSGKALDEAVKRFAAFAAFELSEEPDHWVVQLTGLGPPTQVGVGRDDAARERQVAGELGNYALGLTVQKRERTS